MSVSRIAVSHGSVVTTDSAATMPSNNHGRAEPCARSTSAITHTVSAACTTTTGQKSERRAGKRE